MEQSTSVLFCADTILDHVYLVNCSKLQVIIGGKVPNIVVENCVGVELVIGTQGEEHTVETERSSGIVITIVKLEVFARIRSLTSSYLQHGGLPLG